MENCLVFKVNNALGGYQTHKFNSLKRPEGFHVGMASTITPVSSFKFLPTFVSYGQGFGASLLSRRQLKQYNWVTALANEYFRGCFNLVNFSGSDSVILHVKLKYLLFITKFLKYAP